MKTNTKALDALRFFKLEVAEELGSKELSDLTDSDAHSFLELIKLLTENSTEEAISESVCIGSFSWIKTNLEAQ